MTHNTDLPSTLRDRLEDLTNAPKYDKVDERLYRLCVVDDADFHDKPGEQDVWYGDVRPVPSATPLTRADVLVPELTVYSDYGNGIVHRANCQVLCERHADLLGSQLFKLYGGYNTTGVAVSLDATDDSLIDDIMDLIKHGAYPVLDDSAFSEIESEIIAEDELLFADDFRKGVEKRLLAEVEDNAYAVTFDALESVDEETWLDIMRECYSRADEYPVVEDAVSAWVDVDKLVPHVTLEDIGLHEAPGRPDYEPAPSDQPRLID